MPLENSDLPGPMLSKNALDRLCSQFFFSIQKENVPFSASKRHLFLRRARENTFYQEIIFKANQEFIITENKFGKAS